MIIENSLDLDDPEINFLNEVVNGSSFPLYCNVVDSYGRSSYRAFMHVLMNRGKDKERGIVNSEHYNRFEKIFLKFCKKIDMPVNVVHRAAINFTTYSARNHTPIHVDHNFPHKVFIGYLNDVNEGETLLFNEKLEIEAVIIPEKFKGVVFDSQPHAVKFCRDEEVRVVMVFTFN